MALEAVSGSRASLEVAQAAKEGCAEHVIYFVRLSTAFVEDKYILLVQLVILRRVEKFAK